MTGGCNAVGTWVLGLGVGPIVIDVATAPTDEAIEIPAADAVNWQATSPPGATGARPAKGRVEIDLPWPFGTQTLESWAGTIDGPERAGTYTYELTGAFPRGVDFSIVGSHAEPNVRCTGEVLLKIEGGPFDSWLGYMALGGLVLSGVAFVLAGRSSWVHA